MMAERRPIPCERWRPGKLGSDESLNVWPLAIIRRPDVKMMKNESERVVCDSMFDTGGKNIADTIDADVLSEIKKEDGIDFIEVIERRDKIEEAAIVLFDESELLGMHTSGSKIRECVRMMLDELYRLGELGD